MQFKKDEIYLNEDGVECIFIELDPTASEYGCFTYRSRTCEFYMPLSTMRPKPEGEKTDVSTKCFPVYENLSISESDRRRLIAAALEIQELVAHTDSRLYAPCLRDCIGDFVFSVEELSNDE